MRERASKKQRSKRESNNKMKYATIGTSWITDAFIEAADQSKSAQLASVYSRTASAAKAFAHKHGIECSYSSMEEMLNSDADFVYVASPNRMHPEHIKLCIKKRKHVFCEKPMVYTVKQLEELQRLAKEHDVFIFEGFRHLFSPNYDILKNKLSHVGKIRSAMLQYVKYSSRYDVFKEGTIPNVFAKEFAGGALMDLGVYPLSMAVDLFGQPNDAAYFPVLLANGIDGSGTIVLTYEDFNVTILCSKIADATIPSEIHGEEGTLTMNQIAPIEKLQFYNRTNSETNELAVEQMTADMIYEIQAFIKMVSDNNTALYEKCLERSRYIAEITEKLRRDSGIHFPGE